MDSPDPVEAIDVFVVELRQDQPYLGSLRDGESVNESGYFVRRGNRTVYPRDNRSLVVRITTAQGVEGWGETYGLVVPQATAAIIKDLLVSFVIGRDPRQRESLHDELYDLMRVRGYTGGFYLDALAAIDIALWDIAGKQTGRSVADLLGGRQRDELPAYVSGLPEDTLEKRVELAASWQDCGFDSFKFALPVADQGVVKELHALRQRLGATARIACDMHWAFTAPEAIGIASQMAPDQPWFLEAPVVPEEIDALCMVTEVSGQSIAVGEEWRTLYDARARIDRGACHIIQPEMGHTGITQFVRICRYAQQHQLPIIPHATIGAGIFLAASLQVSLALQNVVSHEFQHSVFEAFRPFTGNQMVCEQGVFVLPNAPGIGVEPSGTMRQHMQPVA